MNDVRVSCPKCGTIYVIPKSSIGKNGKCKKCCAIFKTEAISSLQPAQTDLEQPNKASSKPDIVPASPTHQSPQKKGFFDKMNERAEKASRQVVVTFLQGPWSVNANAAATLTFEDDALSLQIQTGLISNKDFTIPYESITGVTIDTAERMSLTRVLLVGILAFGLKKKEKFLKLDFKDESGMNVSAIFKKGIGIDMDTLSGRILDKRREHLLKIQSAPVASVAEEPPVLISSKDIAASIESLAKLRDQGLLSENEFQTKKAELLARL